MIPSPRHARPTLAFLLSAVCVLASAETWSDTSGQRQAEAEFVGMEGRSILLRKPDGTMVKIAIETLSPESRLQAKRLYLAKQAAESKHPQARQPHQQAPRQEPAAALSKNERWSLSFKVADRTGYAKLVDHFKFEIAVISPQTSSILYVRHLTAPQPQIRQGDIANEKRQPFRLPPGPTHQLQLEALERAGVETNRCLVVVLIDAGIESHLANLELIHLKRNAYRSVNAVKKTNFAFTFNGYDYGFAVSNQQYRTPSSPSKE